MKTNKHKQTNQGAFQVTILGHTKTLNWDKEETNRLLSAFFYGYVVMQVQCTMYNVHAPPMGNEKLGYFLTTGFMCLYH